MNDKWGLWDHRAGAVKVRALNKPLAGELFPWKALFESVKWNVLWDGAPTRKSQIP